MPAKQESAPVIKTERVVQRGVSSRFADKKRIVVVLGMHRSGTSTITRALQALGVGLGEKLIPGIQGDNDKGFWEDIDFHTVNERILDKSGGAWDRLSGIDTERFVGSDFTPDRIDAVMMLESKMRGCGVFGWKDPRTSVTLPFWQCVFEDLGVEPSYVIALRNPLEVAASLHRRDGFDQVKSIFLWLRYTYSALLYTEGENRIVVSYGAMIDDPKHELSRMADSLELLLPNSDSEEVKSYTDEFLDPSLRRNRVPTSELMRSPNVPKSVLSLYSFLERCSMGTEAGEVSTPKAMLNEIGTYLSSAEPLLSFLDRMAISDWSLRQDLVRVESGADDVTENLENAKAQLSQVTDDLQVTLAQFNQATADLERTRDQLSQTTNDLEGARGELKEARAELEEKRDQLVHAETQRAAEKAHTAALDERLEAVQSEKALMGDELDELKGRLSHLEAGFASAIEDTRRLNSELAVAQADVETLAAAEIKIGVLDTKLEQALLQVTDLTGRLADAGEANDALNRDMRALRQDHETASGQLSFTKGKLVAVETAFADLQTGNKLIAEELASAQASYHEREAAAKVATAALNQVTIEYEESIARIAALEGELVAKEAVLIRCTHDIEAREVEHSKLLSEFTRVSQELADAQKLLGELPLQSAKLNEALEQVSVLDGVRMSLGDELSELRKQLRLQRANLYELHNSTSWRVTEPLRSLKHRLGMIKAGLVRRRRRP